MADLTAEALQQLWPQLACQLSLPDMLACTRVSSTVRRSLLKMPSNPWLLAARQWLPGLQATSVQQLLQQLTRAALARKSLLGACDSSSVRFNAENSVVAAVLSPDGCWLAVATARVVFLLPGGSALPHTAHAVGKGCQACTACFSSDSSLLCIVSKGKGGAYQLQSVNSATGQAASACLLFGEAHSCKSIHAGWHDGCLAVSYQFEDAQYGQHLRGVVFDVRAGAAQRRMATPAHWRRLHQPSCSTACFSPDLARIAAVPAAEPCRIHLYDSAFLQQQQHSFQMTSPASVLQWLDASQLLVKGRQPWLALLDCRRRLILWSMDNAAHSIVWPCLGSTSLLLESRQALVDVASSRQLLRVCKASGASSIVSADWDLHSIRLRACTLHPLGCVLAAVHQPAGQQKMCHAVLLAAENNAKQQVRQMASVQSAAHPWTPQCLWSSDGSRLLLVGCTTVAVCDFAV